MCKCNYKDEEIKKMIDEKINSIFKERPGYFKSEWKSKDTNRKYQSKLIPGKDNMNVSNKLSNCNYSSIVSSTVYMNTSETDSSKMDRDVNFNRANSNYNYGGRSTNYNGTQNINNGKKVYSGQENYVYTKSKDYYTKNYDYEENYEHGKTQQDYYKKEEYVDTDYSKNFKVEDGKSNSKSENMEISNKNYKIDLVFNEKKVESKYLFKI